MLLRRITGLHLRLVATHPDGAGDLRLFGQTPTVFVVLALGLSISMAGYILKSLESCALTAELYSLPMSARAAVIVAVFAAPMIAFAKPLGQLKIETRLAAAARTTVNQRAAEREIFDRSQRDATPVQGAFQSRQAFVVAVTRQKETPKHLPVTVDPTQKTSKSKWSVNIECLFRLAENLLTH